ncbi:divalent-cation tolerance protein CutA [Actinoalloteichus sp. AHMU CJ021]|uniref:Divalent cation tolerance protein n=1 Tax=Actinoalloteichus caeruleus DSM 43889 TaxID=1120930 RepID=A0ABT1JML9_ACTCY|nr:divalent-cation tolerance protein CutA [Actinoalloteichus sp. AHMU CJ021]MCP2333780.1 divalent cation tolerance protein [Actinoalloteichus caeruleus DSM 43889]
MSIPEPLQPGAAVPNDPALPSAYCQVTTTTDSEDTALRLARDIVETGLGASAQVLGPISSVYRWAGLIQVTQEWQCVVKTVMSRLTDLTDHIEAIHDREVPEVVATPIIGGNEDYLNWVSAQAAPEDL